VFLVPKYGLTKKRANMRANAVVCFRYIFAYFVRFGPCVDGSELARGFFTFAALVGAAMCSAF
jgi:hypothetical protein